ncbi:hypothetical protein LF1_11630 [Rubripirellula obstinata]|uniref:Uncharacterized protein n=1 Tax=Rubripirellula obstinata TaxID=406547 RepID=A0A5B1CEJ3_9BACT|nr:hypothetical protein LF1_11630 [Rubripirellula obstinata]
MSFESVDKLQQTLVSEVFHYARDRKKAAGRALGTLVEIVTYYLLNSWELRNALTIERSLPEYRNPDITHNVEFSSHPILHQEEFEIDCEKLPLSFARLRKSCSLLDSLPKAEQRNNHLLGSDLRLRNGCTLGETENAIICGHIDKICGQKYGVLVTKLHEHPYAMFECKRVGVEEGQKKGPQTIEKAKQGAYVASSVSSLQKYRMPDGDLGGLLHSSDGTPEHGRFLDMLRRVLDSDDHDLLSEFTMTVGVVSNHGNWFTSDNPNKELQVLAQSYDWLIFFTDQGLSEFINRLLLKPIPKLQAAREAFLESYKANKKNNRFTKVKIDVKADQALKDFFVEYESEVESWFNVISPAGLPLSELRQELEKLRDKPWNEILR